MTELAAIFHWSLADMERLTLPELLAWHGRAVAWWNRVHAGKRG